jgi:hypothetical protein
VAQLRRLRHQPGGVQFLPGGTPVRRTSRVFFCRKKIREKKRTPRPPKKTYEAALRQWPLKASTALWLGTTSERGIDSEESRGELLKMVRPCWLLLAVFGGLTITQAEIVAPVRYDKDGNWGGGGGGFAPRSLIPGMEPTRKNKPGPFSTVKAPGPGKHLIYKQFRRNTLPQQQQKKKVRGSQKNMDASDLAEMRRLISEAMQEPGFDPNGELKPAVPFLHFAALTADQQDEKNPGDQSGYKLLEDLIALGADINVEGSHGSTALHVAAMHDKADAIKFLLKKGADHTKTNLKGHTPLEAAEHRVSKSGQDLNNVISELIHADL